jgi:flagellar biosynthesis/type III secretory pathway protein FliH
MRELFIYAVGATISGTIFLVALVELFFIIRRRKVREELEHKLQELKTKYNESVNTLVAEEEGKLEEADKQVEAAHAEVTTQKEELTKHYQEEIKKLEENSKEALEHARARAKKLEEEAKMKAEAYLETRKTEVEQELMNLVMNVTKKVLPESLSYDLQKELVMRALADAKTGHGNTDS